jgi:hypothetical protein
VEAIGRNRRSVRELWLSVYTNDGRWTELFAKSYCVRGSDVSWDCAWDTNDNVTVVLYDYGLGVSHYDLSPNSPPKRIIRTLRYHFDPNTGKFEEQSPNGGGASLD